MGKINNKLKIPDCADNIDGGPRKRRINIKVFNDYRRWISDFEFLALQSPSYALIIVDLPGKSRQTQLNLIADYLPRHQANRGIKRVLANVFCLLMNIFAVMRKMPYLDIALPGLQWGMARRANAATLIPIGNLADINKCVICNAQTKGDFVEIAHGY